MVDPAVNLDTARRLAEGTPNELGWLELGELLSWVPLQGDVLQRTLTELDASLSDWPDMLRLATLGSIEERVVLSVTDGWDVDDMDVERWLPLIRRIAATPEFLSEWLAKPSLQQWSDVVLWWDVTALCDLGSVPKTAELLPNLSGLGFSPLIVRHGVLPNRVRRDWQAFFKPPITNLRTLDLSDMPVGRRGVEALAASNHPLALQELRLRNAGLQSNGIHSLSRLPDDLLLTILDISRNQGKARDISDFLQSRFIAGLTSLAVGGNNHNDLTARSFLESESLASIRELNLDRSQIDEKWIAEFQHSKAMPSLDILSLSANRIGDDISEKLETDSIFEYLSFLDLSGNQITVTGAISILRKLSNSEQLQLINFRGNRILRREEYRLLHIAKDCGLEILV
jgi:hypothetical protein